MQLLFPQVGAEPDGVEIVIARSPKGASGATVIATERLVEVTCGEADTMPKPLIERVAPMRFVPCTVTVTVVPRKAEVGVMAVIAGGEPE
jgi:hypothetical protein